MAGGEARRFGSDKAEALYQGERLIDRVAQTLGEQSDALIVCGRKDNRFVCVADAPEDGLGPLGGLNAALIYAHRNGFDGVLSAPCDVPDLPSNLRQLLANDLGRDEASFVAQLPLIGLWPTILQPQLERYIRSSNRSMKGFVRDIDAHAVELSQTLKNINRPTDLN